MSSITQLEKLIDVDWTNSVLSYKGQVINDVVRIEEGKIPGKGRIVTNGSTLYAIVANAASFFGWHTNTFDLLGSYYSIRSMIISAVKDVTLSYTVIDKYMLIKDALKSYDKFLESVKQKNILGNRAFIEYYKFKKSKKQELLGNIYIKYKKKAQKKSKEELRNNRVHRPNISQNRTFSFMKIITDYTLWHALDNERIKLERKEFKKLAEEEKITKGLTEGLRAAVINYPRSILFVTLADYFLEIENSSTKLEYGLISLFLLIVGVAPLFEETIKGGLAQNGLKLLQNGVKRISPSILKNNRIIKWLTSPSCRIIVINSLWASVHLLNSNEIGKKYAIIQASNALLYPGTTILFEITQDGYAPIAAHAVNNLISFTIGLAVHILFD